MVFFFFKQKTAYEMRISDWSSDVCSSDLDAAAVEVKGLAPIEPWLNKVRAVDKAGLAALLAEADRTGVSHFFGGYVGQEDKNPEVNTYSLYLKRHWFPYRHLQSKPSTSNEKQPIA